MHPGLLRMPEESLMEEQEIECPFKFGRVSIPPLPILTLIKFLQIKSKISLLKHILS